MLKAQWASKAKLSRHSETLKEVNIKAYRDVNQLNAQDTKGLKNNEMPSHRGTSKHSNAKGIDGLQNSHKQKAQRDFKTVKCKKALQDFKTV